MEVLKAIGFGVVVSLAVGPSAILVMTNGLHHGYPAAVRSAVGAAFADYCYALISFVIGTWLIRQLDQYHFQIILLSSWSLIIIGFYLMCNALRNTRLLAKAHRPGKELGFRSAFFITLANPIALLALGAFIGHSASLANWILIMKLAGAIFIGSLIIHGLFATSSLALKNNDSIIFPFYLQLFSGLAICLFGVSNFVELAG